MKGGNCVRSLQKDWYTHKGVIRREDPFKVLILVSIHHLNTKTMGKLCEQTNSVSIISCCSSPLIQRTPSQHAHCSKVNRQASSRQLCISINLTSHQPEDFCPAEVFHQNLSKPCNSPAVGSTKVTLYTELMIIMKFSLFFYTFSENLEQRLFVCDTSYTEYTIYILLYISITNLALNVGVYRKMPSVLPYFSHILYLDARPFTCNIMKTYFTY